MLIRPWLGRIGKDESIVFVPDKMLQGAPFACLKDSVTGRYLLESHQINVAPSQHCT